MPAGWRRCCLAGHPDENGKPRVSLDRESFARIVDWLDVNAVCYGDYSWNKLEWREPLPEGERALASRFAAGSGPTWPEQPFAALVNVALPEESRILKAPLAAQGRRLGPVAEKGWRDAGRPGLSAHAAARGGLDRPAGSTTTSPAPAAATTTARATVAGSA